MPIQSTAAGWGVPFVFEMLEDSVTFALSRSEESRSARVAAALGMQCMATLALAYHLLSISWKIPVAVTGEIAESLSPSLKAKIDRTLPNWVRWSYIRQRHIHGMRAVPPLWGMGLATLLSPNVFLINAIYREQCKNLFPRPASWSQRHSVWVAAGTYLALAGIIGAAYYLGPRSLLRTSADYHRRKCESAGGTYTEDPSHFTFRCDIKGDPKGNCRSGSSGWRGDSWDHFRDRQHQDSRAGGGIVNVALPSCENSKIEDHCRFFSESSFTNSLCHKRTDYILKRGEDGQMYTRSETSRECDLDEEARCRLRKLFPGVIEDLSNLQHIYRKLMKGAHPDKINEIGGGEGQTDAACLNSAKDFFDDMRKKAGQ